MSEFLTYVQFGIGHIVSASAADHILFLLVLAVVYRLRDWRQVVLVVSAFTVGHSVTLALAVTGAVTPPQAVIEFLIPLTIVLTAVENLRTRDEPNDSAAARYRPALAALFGLVHGAGFAGYLASLFVEHTAVPLAGFNVGIEVGQLLVLAGIALVLAATDAAVGAAQRFRARIRVGSSPRPLLSPLLVRVRAVSIAVGVVATAWTIERSPW